MTHLKATPVLDIKSIAETGIFTGYASVFNHTDSHKDRVQPGAFVPSLAEHKRKGSSVKMFWQHDPGQPIGKWTDLAEDAKGLYVEGRLNMGVQRAREAYALLKEGDIDGLSIGYWPEEAEEDKARPGVMLLKKVRLVEVSVVSMGSNDRALVSDVKSEILGALESTALYRKLVAGEPPTEREIERGLKEALLLTNSQAERAISLIRSTFVPSGDPEAKAEPPAELAALMMLRDAFGDFVQTK